MRRTIPVLFATLLLGGCLGKEVTIETGEVGKILGTSGLEKQVLEPEAFRLDYCAIQACEKLVRLQVNKSTTQMNIDTLFLPDSNVDIRNVQVGIVFQVKKDEDSIAQIYDEVRPDPVEEQVMLISADRVYETYLARKAPDAIVTELRGHTVEDVLTNVPEIAEATKIAIEEMLGDAPIEVTELGFPNGIGEVPEEVIKAKRRLFAVDEEKARTVKALAAELEVEEQRQRVQKVRAQNDVINAKVAGVDYKTYVALKNEERFADAADAMALAVEEGSNDVIVQAPAPQPPDDKEK